MGTTRPPRSAGDVRRAQLALVQLGVVAVDERGVPVEGPVGGGRHVGHQVDVVVAEAADERVGDELDRRPLVVAAHGGERDELVAGGEVRRRRAAVAVDLGRGVGGREPEPAGGDRLAQEAAHGVELGGVGGPLGRGLAHRPPGGWRSGRPGSRCWRRAARPPPRRGTRANVRHRNDSPAWSASTGMDSTRASRRSRNDSSAGATGARVRPQLPPMTVVTPCSGEGDR